VACRLVPEKGHALRTERISALGDAPVVRACGRWWTNEDLANLREMWNSPRWFGKQIAERYGVKVESLRSIKARKKLGLGCRPPLMGRRFQLDIPKHCHPFVRFIFRRMNSDNVTFRQLGKRSGVDASTIHQWDNMNPRIHNIEAVLNALGYCLKIVPLEDEKEDAA